MPFQWVRRALLVAASSVLLAACGGGNEVVSQLAPARVVAFGDAFSDVGQTGNRYTVNEAGAVNWTQQIAAHYGLPLTPASVGGFSYATGNARVAAVPDAAGNAATPTVSQQVGNFLAARSFGGSDLVLMNGGISDIVAEVAAFNAGRQSAAQARANVGQAGRDFAAQVKRVVASGARYVVVSGSYNLGRTPWAVSTGQAGFLTDLSTEFNDQLLVSLVNEGRNVLYVDAALYFNLVTASPATYNFNNISTPVCTSVDPGPGIGIGANQVNSALCTTATLSPSLDSSRSLYADPVNLTTRGQILFGDYAFDRVRLRF